MGTKQLEFLERWSRDRQGQICKVIVSQTVYAAMHTTSNCDLERDPDSNGFPKVGRDRAVDMFRRCGALLVCGDQHLATFAHLGVERHEDTVYQFCVPALGNIFWRWFYPREPGRDRKPGEPEHLGRFTDPWGNYFHMIAVANPEGEELYKREGSIRRRPVVPETKQEPGVGVTQRTCQGDGYGIVRLDKSARKVRIECWPYDADPESGDAMFKGWPIELEFDEL